ncbi:hypothetical protein SAMN05421820_107165 [Pedobacter steynii]|uniref:Uncharacterized protein n=1 Tax=Pedobacter steynii TaxID=430522 RepID=A0A1H0AQ39_9SPHI|nr:hypothetical protein [Pedobacter steynii]NQX41294.1 hypothetical protein [Pedobacter steynii]SDN35511.1 hypothetical protein SAMN05421820_107165 [Pedobacter steynii]
MISAGKMNFFFEYIYYRITQLFFKRDGRTGFTGIAIISLMQTLFVEAILIGIGNRVIAASTRALHAKQFGYIGAAIALYFMIYNYKKYNGKYNKYRYYWKEETKETRLLKGCYILLAFLFPIALVIIFGVHWEK